MHIRSCLQLTAFISIAGLATAAPPSNGSVEVHATEPGQGFVFSEAQAQEWFIGDFVRWAISDIGHIPQPDAILAIGSSSMRMWGTIHDDLPGPVIHRGFGGSKMKDVLPFLNFFTRYQCQRVLVYEGDNDLASPQSDVQRDFIEPTKQFIDGMRAGVPGVQIYFVSIKPSLSRMSRMEAYREANEQLQAMCEAAPDLHYIDVFTPMLDESGTPRADIFKGDKLHMNETGYGIWTEQIRPQLEAR